MVSEHRIFSTCSTLNSNILQTTKQDLINDKLIFSRDSALSAKFTATLVAQLIGPAQIDLLVKRQVEMHIRDRAKPLNDRWRVEGW